MPFRLVAVLLAAVFLILFVILGFFPLSYLSTYGVTGDAAAAFITRRAAPMFLGLAVLLVAIRDAPAGPIRNGVAVGLAVLFAGIAATGIYEFARGFAAPAILLAAAGELFAAAVLLLTCRAR